MNVLQRFKFVILKTLGSMTQLVFIVHIRFQNWLLLLRILPHGRIFEFGI